MVDMRYRRAVEKLRILADACERTKLWSPEEPFLLEAHVFGDVLEGADPVGFVQLAFVLNLPPEEVPWGCTPRGTAWLDDVLELGKGSFACYWRSHLNPVPNHQIRGPVRFWSLEGPDEVVLRTLTERRFADLPRLAPAPETEREQLAEELGTALSLLREMQASYWDPQWRREHRGSGRYPEHYLWEAVYGYLDLHDAARSQP